MKEKLSGFFRSSTFDFRFAQAKCERGFSLVEIVVAASIISVALLAILGIANKAIVTSQRSLNTYMASTLLEEGVEAVRTIRDGSWSNISSLTAGTTYYPSFSTSTNLWSLSSTASTVGIFTRTVTITAVNRDANDDIAVSGTNDPGTKLVTVSVSWPQGTTTASRTIQFYTFDIF